LFQLVAEENFDQFLPACVSHWSLARITWLFIKYKTEVDFNIFVVVVFRHLWIRI